MMFLLMMAWTNVSPIATVGDNDMVAVIVIVHVGAGVADVISTVDDNDVDDYADGVAILLPLLMLLLLLLFMMLFM